MIQVFKPSAHARPASMNALMVPTLCVVTRFVTLSVTSATDAERPSRHTHAERGHCQRLLAVSVLAIPFKTVQHRHCCSLSQT